MTIKITANGNPVWLRFEVPVIHPLSIEQQLQPSARAQSTGASILPPEVKLSTTKDPE
jgi:hypothetical protein